MYDPTISHDIYRLLHRLGVLPSYHGFFHIAYGVHLASTEPTRMRCASKQIYPAIAAYYGTTPAAAERNIRTAAHSAWAKNPALLAELAQHPLHAKPTNMQLLSILAHAILLPATQ